MANQIKLTVGGINYTVKSDESAEYLEQLGDELEERLRRITKRNPTISTTMVAVIAALPFATAVTVPDTVACIGALTGASFEPMSCPTVT